MNGPDYPRPYGSYLLLERLGAGGMSEVDLARRAVGDGAFMRFLAIKRIRAGNAIDEQYVRMFQDEARINAELSHENIAQVYDFGREGDEFYMAMEYVPGLDLRAVQVALAKRGRLVPLRMSLTVLCGVLRALQYAHTRVDQLGRPMNIVHRDVNPRNVMISVNGEVKLIDFGVAKAADRLERTEGNAVKGKFAYMAPEQIEGNGTLDGRADLYAVALVMHELLTGRSPFAGLTEVQILHRIVSGRVPPLPDGLEHPDVPMLRAIHARGLAIRPDQRYGTADEMRRDLEAALVPLGGPSPASGIAELLREANQEGVVDITRRLRAYREREATVASAPVVHVPPPGESSGTLNVAAIEAPPRKTGILLGVAAGAALVGVLGVGLVAVIGIAWWALQDRAPAPAAPAPVPVAVEPAPPVVETPAPQPATVKPTAPAHPVSAAPKPAAPATVPSAPPTVAITEPVPAPGPSPAPEAPPVPAPAPPVATAPVAPAPAPAAASGFLNLTSRPVKLDVFLDGARIGATPIRMQRVPAGTHEIVVRDPATGRSTTRSVTVTPDGVATPEAVILE